MVVGQASVRLRHGEDLLHVPVRVVVGIQGSVPVPRRSTVFEVAGGRWYGVFGVHYVRHPVAVAIHAGGLPRRWQELHRAHRTGARRTHVLAVIRLDLPHGSEYVPIRSEPVVPGRLLVELYVLFLWYRVDGTGDYVLARDLELVPATRFSPAGGRRAL